MSCTVMYQPYAMSYSSSSTSASCDRSSSSSSSDKKLFKLPQAPSPPDSLNSDTSSYNSPGPGTSSTPNNPSQSHSHASSSHTQSRRPLTPVVSGGPGSGGSSSGGIAIPSSSRSTTSSLEDSTEESPSAHVAHRPSSHHHHHSSSSSSSSHHPLGSSSSHHHSVASSSRAHYLSANSVIYFNYNGDASRIVDEHFSRALNGTYAQDKLQSKSSPMSTRNFPPSFWNSNYQPSKPLAISYGTAAASAAAAEFYGAAVDYGGPIPGLAHHHQPDPWHYTLPTPHQSYHHRPSEIPYPPMPSSRFNAAQYGSFFLAGAAAASSGAGRFGAMPGSSQCGIKGDSSAWASTRYHHHHHHHPESLSDLHNLADYSAAAAAHYSNMTAAAGLETSVQDSSNLWF